VHNRSGERAAHDPVSWQDHAMGEAEDRPPRTLLVVGPADQVGSAMAAAGAALTAAGLAPAARADGPAEAARMVVADPPELVVVPVVGGAAAVEAVIDAAPTVPVLVLVDPAAERHSAVLAAVSAGATSVVLEPRELADAAWRTAAGDAVFSPGLADLVLDAVSPDGAAGAKLTERETDILRLVVDGLTAKQIASRLVLSQRTVENHVQNMLRKLRLTGRAALVRYAIENGLA
jgi:DNA-binding NarL/FixJ family response regulator